MSSMLRAFGSRGRARTVAVTLVVAGPLVLALAMALQRPSPSAAAVRTPTPPATVAGTLIIRPTGTLKPGSLVKSADLGLRVFPNAKHGFALADVGQAQYPAATVDGGKIWRTDGPALHLNAAQAPLVVQEVGAANQRTFFAWGGGQVVDVTSDAGKHWYRAILGDVVMAVVSPANGQLVAFAQTATGSGSTAVTWVYVSKDGGRQWHYSDSLGGF
jgi:hypothetical protein